MLITDHICGAVICCMMVHAGVDEEQVSKTIRVRRKKQSPTLALLYTFHSAEGVHLLLTPEVNPPSSES